MHTLATKIKPLIASLLEWVAVKLNIVPKPLFDTCLAFNQAMVIMTAADLNIFEVIGRNKKTADEIAQSCNTHPWATKHLLDCLVGVGYLRWNNEKYVLKRKYYKWLLKESDCNILGQLKFQLLEWNRRTKLGDYVRNNKPIEMHNSSSEDEWELYQEAMRDMAINPVKQFVKKISLPENATQMLDIGGSHGLFSIELCNIYPNLNSTILELPLALNSACAIANRYDKTNRVKYVAGDVLTDDLGSNLYDVVLLNNVAHHFTAEQNQNVTNKVASALKPGGIFAIGEFIGAERPDECTRANALLGMIFSSSSASGNWSSAEIHSWFIIAGLKPEKNIALFLAPGWEMFIAIKQ